MDDRFSGCSIGFEGMDPSAFEILPGQTGHFTGSARYAASGPSSGELKVQISQGEWAGATIQPATARLGFAPGVVTLDPLDVKTSLGEAKFAGSFFSDGRIEGPLQLIIPDVSKLEPLIGRTLPSGALKATLELRWQALQTEGSRERLPWLVYIGVRSCSTRGKSRDCGTRPERART